MTHEDLCPLCARDLQFPHQIDVCGDCHSSLQVSGVLALSTTSEFRAVPDPRPPEAESRPNEKRKRAGTEETDSPHCCWCKKEPEDVRKMLSQGRYHICNECVFLCADILRMELGDDFS